MRVDCDAMDANLVEADGPKRKVRLMQWLLAISSRLIVFRAIATHQQKYDTAV
jgi:hypothetical protein